LINLRQPGRAGSRQPTEGDGQDKPQRESGLFVSRSQGARALDQGGMQAGIGRQV
jgi:hypothetical protein